MTLAPYGPVGRGRWRLTLHNRAYTATRWQATVIAELTAARSRRLDLTLNRPAQLTFTLDGHASEAAQMLELATEVIAWRWSDAAGADVAMFRGVVDHTEDQITEQSHVLNVTCHDYSAMLARRYLTANYGMTQWDQDSIAVGLLSRASFATASSGASFSPAAFLPLVVNTRNPDGSNRVAASGQLRDRNYLPNQEIGQALNDLALVINGFDYAVAPLGNSDQVQDALNLYYPMQGVARTDVALVYGANVSAVTRTVDSTVYANYQRVLGNNGSSDPAAAQLFSERWNTDANNVTVNPVGLWQATDNAADVTIQSTLDQKAAGDLNLSGLLVPSYTVTLRAEAYHYGQPNLGDTVPLVVKSGRLNVNTTIRVLGLSFAVSDDDAEDVSLTVGRPLDELADLFTQADRDADALARR